MNTKYTAQLSNNDGCIFDCMTGNNVKSIKEWARGRGGVYKLILMVGESYATYLIRNNRLCLVRA